MRFAFTSEQLAIRDSARAVFERTCPASRLREAWSSEDGAVPELSSRLAELGLPGLLAREADGGAGLGEVELALVLQEHGRFAVPGNFAPTASIAVPLLRDGAEKPRARWLRALASGTATAAVGFADSAPVLGAGTADVLLLKRDDELHAVDRRRAMLTPKPAVDGARRLFDVRWSPSEESLVAAGPAAKRLLADALDRGALAAAAELLGLARQMIDTTVAYVKSRHQFGRPVGSFQAIKHHLADAHIAVETSAPAVYRAAWSLAARAPERTLHTSMAKALASEAALLAARKALQCHGAIGYAIENDLHMWMKRTWALAAAWGDAGWHRERVARILIPRAGEVGG